MRRSAGTKAVRSYVDVDIEMKIKLFDDVIDFAVFSKAEELLSNDMTIQLSCIN